MVFLSASRRLSVSPAFMIIVRKIIITNIALLVIDVLTNQFWYCDQDEYEKKES